MDNQEKIPGLPPNITVEGVDISENQTTADETVPLFTSSPTTMESQLGTDGPTEEASFFYRVIDFILNKRKKSYFS